MTDGVLEKCSFCDGLHSDCIVWTGATDIDESGYSAIIVKICPKCRRDPETVDAKLRQWATRLRGQAAVLESLNFKNRNSPR